MALNLRGGVDRGVVRFKPFQRLLLNVAGEKFALQRAEFFGDVVGTVKVGVLEYCGENFLGQDVLNEHFAHVGIGETRVDRLLRVGEKFLLGSAEFFIRNVLALDRVAQRGEHGGQVGFELFDGVAEAFDLRPLESEESFEQPREGIGVFGVAANCFLTVLDQHERFVVAEDDVVLRIALLEFFCNLGVEVVR